MPKSKTTFRTAKLILERMLHNLEHPKEGDVPRGYEAIHNYLNRLSLHDRDMLMKLGDHRNGVEDYLRTLVKEHFTPAQFEAMVRDARARGIRSFEWGGRRTRKRRSRRH